MASDAVAPPPVPFLRLKEIANEACETTFSSVTSYHHPSTESWNTSIINTILAALIKATSSSTTTPAQTPYKFAVTSTIIEHVAAPSSPGTTTASVVKTEESEDEKSATPPYGRRGMHSATGAYWNTEKDGMWSYKYEAGEGKGIDVVVGILWIAV